MLTEFGGIRFTPGGAEADAWGYSAATSAEDFRARLAGLLEAVHDSDLLAGFCYTQLTDVEQEQNGVYNYARSVKFDMARIAAIFGKTK